MRLLWLPEVLRSAGLTVHEVTGWRTRGSSTWGPIVGITCHHTAGARTSTDAGELRVLVNGRGQPGDPDYLPGPISQLYLSRTGHWHVVASGRANHNKVGWAGPNEGYGNSQLIGVEAQHAGGTEPWTPVQYQSYARGVAALCRRLGISPNRVGGHKEHQPGEKTDPSFNMTRFRTDVATALRSPQEEDMAITDEDVVEIWSANAGSAANPVRVLDRINQIYVRQTEDAVRDAALLAAVNNDGDREAVLAAVEAARSELAAQISQVDEEFLSKLGNPEASPEAVADLLRAALGDRADDVFRAGLGQ